MKTNGFSNNHVMLVGYENQENLGLRSIIAYLQTMGYRVHLVPFLSGQDGLVLEEVKKHQPILIGFSLIFQFSIETFSALMRYLRLHQVSAHFTAGGHFPSLRPAETLELIPELDTIVRFEGEETLLELLRHLESRRDWSSIKGIAYRDNGAIIETPLRPFIENLDALPFVYRNGEQKTVGEIPTASMLASRGCHFNCSFCSIRQFYGSLSGKLRRSRSPERVAEEMQFLFENKGVRFFSFQDDDFASRSPVQKTWIRALLNALRKKNLSESIKWKISCRVDDVETDLLQEMVEHGLFAIYLGVESGNQIGLNTLNKQVSVQKNQDAIALVKDFNLALSIGFMLFDPSSTASSIVENINFLEWVGHDGYFPINFCKMLPYAGTPIEQQLRESGRLTGTITHPDYEFLTMDINWYAFLVQRVFMRRNFSDTGVIRLQNTDFEYRLANAFAPGTITSTEIKRLRTLISRSNTLAIQTLRELLEAIETMGAEELFGEENTLLSIVDREWSGENEIQEENHRVISALQSKRKDIHSALA